MPVMNRWYSVLEDHPFRDRIGITYTFHVSSLGDRNSAMGFVVSEHTLRISTAFDGRLPYCFHGKFNMDEALHFHVFA